MFLHIFDKMFEIKSVFVIFEKVWFKIDKLLGKCN